LKLRPEEITSILKQRIEEYDVEIDLSEVGTVLQVGDGIARVYGLENCVALERLEFEHGVVGKVLDSADQRRLVEEAVQGLDFSALEKGSAN
jgi:F-type H+-transporting ATPase subunit alpha